MSTSSAPDRAPSPRLPSVELMAGQLEVRERGVMDWSAVLLALLVSHLVGDFLVQTEWQAQNKRRGITDRMPRRALARHVLTYTLSFVPALAWIGRERGTLRAAEVGALVAVPHLLVDDGRLVQAWLRRVKNALEPEAGLVIAVDQSFHVLCLLGAALRAAS